MSTFNPKNLYLERVGGGSHFRNVRFDKESSVLGRHESCDLIVGGRTVSRLHCAFTFANGKLYVTNLSASTSTFLNDDKVNVHRCCFKILSMPAIAKFKIEMINSQKTKVLFVSFKAFQVL